MKNKSLKLLFCLTLLSVLFMILGCGSGGSQSVLQQESPEAAVMRISNDWRASTESPAVIVDANNRFIRQATVQETETNSSSNLSGKVIYLQDLISSETYKLEVVDVERVNDRAAVTCNFYYENGTLNIVFKLEFEEGKWWLEDVIITDSPFAKGEAGYKTIHHLMVGKTEPNPDLYSDFGKGKIGEEVEAEPKTIDGFMFDPDYPNTIATGTILATTDSGYPLTLELYYRKLATYTLTIYLLDENNNVSPRTTEVKGVGYVGDKASLTKEDLERTLTGYSLITEKISDTIKNITEIELQDSNTNELKLYYKLDETNPETNKISGTISDEKGNIAATIQLFKVNEDGEAVPVERDGKPLIISTENGEYSFEGLEDGIYLLVVTANGYEPKTIKVTLPQDVRANIKL